MDKKDQIFTSNQCNMYSVFVSDVKYDLEHIKEFNKYQTNLRCPITLDTIDDSKKYTQWIQVPTENPCNTIKYSLNGICEYFNNKGWENVPDPTRNFISPLNLDFMSTRILYQNSLPNRVKKLPIEYFNDESKKKILTSIIKSWKDPTIDQNVRDLNMFVGLSTWENNKYIFTKTTSYQVISIFEKAKAVDKSFLLRESNYNAGDGRGHATIFTMSYKKEQEYRHIRFMSVHCVGVYTLTAYPGDTHSTTAISRKPCMSTLMIKDIIRDTYANGVYFPQYASVNHALEYMDLHGYIDLAKIILPSDII
jgi:metal-sulfur cluster biosynthetic enzyme